MNAPNDIRRQVMAAIIEVMAEAEAAGGDAFEAARRAFPGTPGTVLGEAYAEVMEAAEDAWWLQVERTIDGEIIRNAIVVTSSAPTEAGARDTHLDEAFKVLTAEGGGAP